MGTYIIDQRPCPKCRAMGKDKSGDNFAMYNDGHSYCFGCGYYIGNNVSSLHNTRKLVNSNVSLPEDCNTNYPDNVLEWVGKYHLTKRDLLKYNVLYSLGGIRFNRKGVLKVADKVLVFPVFNEDSLLVGLASRYFGEDKEIPKWISKGLDNDVYNILTSNMEETIILVEDIVSAIKVHKAGYNVLPVYGSSVKNRFERLKKLGYKNVVIWLDPDMKVKMIKECSYAKTHNITTRVIFSDFDPKEYTLNEIERFINE